MPSVAETLHWLRDQRDRLKMEAEEKRSLKVLGHELDKLRQEIRDLGGEPCCLLEDYPVARSVTPQQLRDRAELIRCWQQFELGLEPPPPLNYMDTARLLDEAAEEIEIWRAARLKE